MAPRHDSSALAGPVAPGQLQQGTGQSSTSMPAQLPLRRDTDSPAIGIAGYSVWLLAILAVTAGVWAVRARGGKVSSWRLRLRPGNERALKLVNAQSLGTIGSLQVVQWDGRELLLGCTPHSIRLLDSRPAPGQNAPQAQQGAAATGGPDKAFS